MTWTRLSDDFPDECEPLSVNARWLHLEGLCWSGRKLLDCKIPKPHLRKFATEPDYVTELLEHGYWQDAGDTYVIRHGAMYQRSREDVMAAQERARVNGAKNKGRPKARGTDVPEPKSVTHVGTQTGTQVGSQDGSAEAKPKRTASTSPSVQEPRSVTQQLTQRERTGTAKALRDGTNNESGWPARSVPGDCSVCRQPLVSVDGSTTHPTCDPLEAIA